MSRHLFLTFAVIAVISAAEARAQIPIEVYENPSNLQVLSPDIPAEDLRDAMATIGQSVGIRCSRCHDFEPGTPLSDRDYASDDKELKRVAREMMRMVQGINETVSAIDRGPDHEALTVQCITCHRGVSQPRQIDDIFTHTMQEDGLSAAVDEYIELRETWYAMSAYDFTAWKLGGIAQEIVDSGDIDAGMQVHALNFELNPNDGSVYFHRGETYEKQGRIDEAVADFEQALEMEPESLEFLAEWIARLEAELDE